MRAPAQLKAHVRVVRTPCPNNASDRFSTAGFIRVRGRRCRFRYPRPEGTGWSQSFTYTTSDRSSPLCYPCLPFHIEAASWSTSATDANRTKVR